MFNLRQRSAQDTWIIHGMSASAAAEAGLVTPPGGDAIDRVIMHAQRNVSVLLDINGGHRTHWRLSAVPEHDIGERPLHLRPRHFQPFQVNVRPGAILRVIRCRYYRVRRVIPTGICVDSTSGGSGCWLKSNSFIRLPIGATLPPGNVTLVSASRRRPAVRLPMAADQPRPAHINDLRSAWRSCRNSTRRGRSSPAWRRR